MIETCKHMSRALDGSAVSPALKITKLAMPPGHFISRDAKGQPETRCEISCDYITEVMHAKINPTEPDGDNKRNRNENKTNPKGTTGYHQVYRVG